ncbi:hypothetical protein GCM10009799_52000 [Nocardiopsis rhodophaea]|uniref:Bacterial EndoU nuclease domain-containing protein n=1 Tax=Nocardiopsis rhodophaea TaxID=280238 RepID=A0ABP5F894_9ACTN
MRWVWRAESGGFKVEYAAVVLLVTVVATAVLAFGLPTEVKSLYATGVCRITDGEDCDDRQGESSATEPGDTTDDTPEADAPDANPMPPDGGNSPEGKNDPDGAADSESSDAPEGDGKAAYDPKLAQAFYDADSELDDAQSELDKAKQALKDTDYDKLGKDLLELVGDIIGYNDARDCLTKGDLMACLWTVVGFTPWGKGAKLVKAAPKILKFWNRWRKARKARDAAQKIIDKAKKKVDEKKKKRDDALSDCQEAGKGRRSNFTVGAPTASEVDTLLAPEGIRLGFILQNEGGPDPGPACEINAHKDPRKPDSAAPKGSADNALKGFKGRHLTFGDGNFLIDKSGVKHALKRHHPDYWDGSEKGTQTFFKKGLSPSDIADIAQDVMKQNRETLAKKGTNDIYQIEAVVDGERYVVGINNGRVGQIYPKY